MNQESPTTTPARAHEPVIRHIVLSDITDALAAGVSDFRAYPAYGLFFGAFYALGGLVILGSTLWWDLLYLVYPLAAGFTLLGPFVAVGLYEVSRLREMGRIPTWKAVIGAMYSQSGKEISWMAFAVLFIFIVWMYQVR